MERSTHRDWCEREREHAQSIWKRIIGDVFIERIFPHSMYIKMFLEDNYRKRMYIHPDGRDFEK